ncbi:hypothetical protein CAQU_10405 [Corynebacterium aquilae DSM 44791]|uniref:CAF17 C-terminal domain-containing protein n=1 Tax=Corynebacterium aquilae DSM 44791 TaxID=1431546 RepID=A0A1L7CI03_9CORY|nr:hypothetical protein CAQU_10405 [Corynebacterium aquilae DSM 44791]
MPEKDTTARYRSALLDWPGAAPATDPTALEGHGSVAWHYGDPLGEQHKTTVFIDRSHLATVAITGADAATLCNSLLSQKLDDAAPGTLTEALNLDAQGRVLHHAHVVVGDNLILLTAEDTHAHQLSDYITKMVFWNDAEVRIHPLGIMTLLGDPDADIVAETRHLATLARDCGATTHPATITPDDLDSMGGILRPIPEGPRARVDVLLPREHTDAFARALSDRGAHPAGLLTFTAHRVFAMDAQTGIDSDERTIPHENPQWVRNAVHLNKGCYRGQETVARVDNIGQSPRALVRVLLDGSCPQLPAPGAPITSGGRPVGFLGTIAQHHEWGPVGLAMIKRSALGSAALQCEQAALTIDRDSLPEDSGPKAGKLAQQRLKGQL